MKTTVALSCLLSIAVMTVANGAYAGQIKTVAPPHMNISQPKIGSATGGAGAGKVTFNPFQITRKVDSASPKLYETVSTGKHIPTATINVRKSDDESPKESVDLNFSKIEYHYNK